MKLFWAFIGHVVMSSLTFPLVALGYWWTVFLWLPVISPGLTVTYVQMLGVTALFHAVVTVICAVTVWMLVKEPRGMPFSDRLAMTLAAPIAVSVTSTSSYLFTWWLR